MKKIVITGADGFVGLNLTQTWASRFALTGFVLPHRKSFYEDFCKALPQAETQIPVKILAGTFAETSALKEAVKDADYVIHCVGNMLGRKYEKYYAANARSVFQLLEAIQETNPNIQRVILMSSQAAMGPASPNSPQTESDPTNPISFYGRSKLEGELFAESFFKKLPVTILRPCSIYGPWDRSFLRMFQYASRGQFGILYNRETQFNIIHVRDLVRAIEVALQDEGSGHRFLIADSQPHIWNDLIQIFSEIHHRPMKIVHLDSWLADLYLRYFDFQELLTGKSDILSSAKAEELKEKNWLCSAEKFSKTFSWLPQIPLKQGFTEQVEWCKTMGWT